MVGQALTTSQGYTRGSESVYGYTAGNSYTQMWYQPKYAKAYAAGGLRRYHTAAEDQTSVRAFCVSARNLSSSTKFGVIPADVSGYAGVVSLSGAITLTAGAVIFGMT